MRKYKIEFISTVEESISLTPSEWTVVAVAAKQQDFNQMIAELKRQFGVNPDDIKQVLSSLQKKRVLKVLQIQENQETQENASHKSDIPEGFWDMVTVELSKAIGPIAEIVIDDAVGEFNVSKNNFPAKNLYSLVEKVAGEVESPGEKRRFQDAMLAFINENM